MIFKSLLGHTKKVQKIHKYRIKWDEGSRSKIQSKVKQYLKSFWCDEVVYEEFPVAGTKMTLDFYNATRKIAIEVQGRQHTKYIKFMHGSKMGYLSQLKRDSEKLRFCQINNITLVEFYDGEELNSLKEYII